MSRQPPVARVGEYHVLDFVGAGGMGEVFRAVHSRTGQVAAVKFLTGGAEMSPEARVRWRNRFIHEARVQESLRHPNLAAFYEWHEVGGTSVGATPCIVMEFVDGTTLGARLQTVGAMPWREALAVFARVVEAVAFMHEKGVIHRDIKSSNVKINGRGEIKILDFGIAKTDDMARLTATGAFVGTLQYLSPEQVKGRDPDARCDVWALGALFYELLSGKPPFEAPTWGELLEKVARAQYEPLEVRVSNLPREVEAVVRRCLQKQPAARFANGGELLAALQQIQTPAAPNAKDEAGLNIARFKPTSPVPFFVAGCVGVAVLMTWLLWPPPPGGQGGNATVNTNATPVPLVLTGPNVGGEGARTNPQPLNTSSGEPITITIDVFEGAEQTQITCNDRLLGRPPCQYSGRVGDHIEVQLSRPGYQTRRESFALTQSRSNYSFSLEPVS